MPAKGDRSKRRRPRKGFPHPATGYLDDSTHEMVSRAAPPARDCGRHELAVLKLAAPSLIQHYLPGATVRAAFAQSWDGNDNLCFCAARLLEGWSSRCWVQWPSWRGV